MRFDKLGIVMSVCKFVRNLIVIMTDCNGLFGFRVYLMILLYLDCDIAFPSPAFARAGDGAAHGA